jgi:hypothetical protein
LSQSHGLNVPLPNRFLVFDKAFSRFRGRASSVRNFDNVERVRQSLTNKVDPISALDATTRRCPLAVDLYMPSGYRS